MGRRQRVMLIIPEMGIGGAQRSLAKLSTELATYYEIYLVVFNLNYTFDYQIKGTLLNLNVHPGPTLLSKLKALLQRIWRVRKLKRLYKIDCAISFLEGADYVNILSSRGERVVVSIRGSKIHDENMYRYFFWLRKSFLIPILYRRADAIVAVNRGISYEMIDVFRLLPERVTTIGNFYDIREVTERSREERDEKWVSIYTRPVLIVTGRVSREKGVSGIIRVFARLRIKHPGIVLVIVGNGPDMEHVQSDARREGLRIADAQLLTELPDVVFAGIQINVYKYLRGATAYLMNSSSEGFPNGLVEAMICKVPIVTSNCPYGPAELLNPNSHYDLSHREVVITKYGYLLPRADSEDSIDVWAECLSRLLSSNDIRTELTTSAYERVHDFNKELVIEQWRKVVESQ